ncbi:hypothetical protein OHA10_35020 [Kribbella sp. NBC_00662]|uniref:hypothetical protein n=1 Tax=Kribbella sp. NBC_00662 TaxID=2975969 RepID=UPI003253EE18
MTFLDLTPTWTDHPLTDPADAANVVDLMLTLGDRHRGTFTVLLCDPDNHYRATISIDLPPNHPWPPHDDPPRHPSRGDLLERSSRVEPKDERPGAAPDPDSLCANALAPLVPAIQTAPGTGVILALGRPGPARSPALDHQWAQAATAICQAADLRLLGFYIATSEGVYQPLDDSPLTNRPPDDQPPTATPPADYPLAGESAADRPRVGQSSAA